MKLGNHTKVGIDANVLIYLIEDRGVWAERAAGLFSEMTQRRITPVCSALAATEILQHPLPQKEALLVSWYQELLFSESTIVFVPVTVPAATYAAYLAARYDLKTPDAVHIECVLFGKATAFVTADKGIKNISELEIIQL